MSRKDYVRAAESIAKSGYGDGLKAIIAREFADFFAADNGTFDRGRFYRAAGVDEVDAANAEAMARAASFAGFAKEEGQQGRKEPRNGATK